MRKSHIIRTMWQLMIVGLLICGGCSLWRTFQRALSWWSTMVKLWLKSMEIWGALTMMLMGFHICLIWMILYQRKKENNKSSVLISTNFSPYALTVCFLAMKLALSTTVVIQMFLRSTWPGLLRAKLFIMLVCSRVRISKRARS